MFSEMSASSLRTASSAATILSAASSVAKATISPSFPCRAPDLMIFLISSCCRSSFCVVHSHVSFMCCWVCGLVAPGGRPGADRRHARTPAIESLCRGGNSCRRVHEKRDRASLYCANSHRPRPRAYRLCNPDRGDLRNARRRTCQDCQNLPHRYQHTIMPLENEVGRQHIAHKGRMPLFARLVLLLALGYVFLDALLGDNGLAAFFLRL